ncbi:MAG: glycosyltransferase family 2 protein [Candidatus Rokubacteria bacterium]|nr:glycosyltransferase family 2 protein [Candidatus Rokubacteria bacterium]
MSRPDVSIVVVSYNVRDDLAECLGSLATGAPGLETEILVVDNASSDASAELVARDFPLARLIANHDNVGFARAVNQALAHARGRYVLLLNPDTVMPPGALTRLVALADQRPGVGLLAPETRDPATGAVQTSLRPFPTWAGILAHYTVLKPVLRLLARQAPAVVVEHPTTEGWLVGACLLIRRELLEQIGGLDGAYFLFFEDTDYARRAIRAGWHVLGTREVMLWHKKSRSVAKEAAAEMKWVEVESLFHYLAGEPHRHSRFRRQVLTTLLVVTSAVRFATNGVKAPVCAVLGRSGPAARHRRRAALHAGLLRRLLAPRHAAEPGDRGHR